MADSEPIGVCICMGSSCFARGNGRTLQVLTEYLKTRGRNGAVELRGALCANECSQGPNVTIDGQTHRQIDASSIQEVLDHRVRSGRS